MTKEELKQIIDKMPDTFSIENENVWYTKKVCKGSWYHDIDKVGFMGEVPTDVCDGDRLSARYDYVSNSGKGKTPTIDDFKALVKSCEQKHVDGDSGLLLSYNNNYMYIPKGEYWTSSYCQDEYGRVNPYCAIVNDGKISYIHKYRHHKVLDILGMK